ncbi:hypothetical protein BGX24_005367, partial [Mortierella sp. AD032]
IRAVPCTSASLVWNRQYNLPGPQVRDPVNDLHGFGLIVKSRYNEKLPLRPTKGKKSSNYKETRTSNDKLWSVEHTDEWYKTPIILTAKGKKHVFNNPNSDMLPPTSWKLEYWTCIDW